MDCNHYNFCKFNAADARNEKWQFTYGYPFIYICGIESVSISKIELAEIVPVSIFALRSRYLGYEYLRILCSIPSLFSCESHARSARNNHAERRISEVFPSCTNSDRDHVACRMCKSKGRRIGRSPERVLSRGTLIAVYRAHMRDTQGRACCTRVYTRVYVRRGRERERAYG